MPKIMNPAAQRILAPSRNIQTRQSWQGAQAPVEPVYPAGSHANLQLYSQNLPASGTMVLDSGNFFFLLSSASTVNLLLIYATGGTEIMNSIPVGAQIKRVRPWTRAQITGVGGSAVTFWHGYEFSREDQTNFQAQIATISGNVLVVPGTGNAFLIDHADVTVAATTIDTSIGTNSRRSVSVGSFSSNTPASLNLRVTLHGSGLTRGVELQPGQFINIATQQALDVNNPDANAQKYWWQEY